MEPPDLSRISNVRQSSVITERLNCIPKKELMSSRSSQFLILFVWTPLLDGF